MPSFRTWGADEDTLQDFRLGGPRYINTRGYRKIRFCAEQAWRDGLSHSWVDTCCIDKSSSAELSEAINSMFRSYRDATKCYVYLADVPTLPTEPPWESAFRDSRWFTRGWTLQELIAPRTIEFCDQN